MKPVELEIIMRDSTRQGMQSVAGNISGMETQMQEVISILKKELVGLQDAFKNALSQGVSSPSDLADIQALKGKIGELEEQLKMLKTQAEVPVKPNIDLSKYVTDEIRAMENAEDRVKGIIISIQQDINALRSKSLETAATGVINPKDAAEIKALEAQVRSLTDTLGRYDASKRESYATPVIDEQMVTRQTNNLKLQFSQVARELPALAMGPQMFILAISNNLPMLADAVKNVREQNELLAKSGQKSTSVWKQLLSAAGSWQTMLVVGITLLTVYGKEIWECTKGLFKAKDAILDLSSAENEMALARQKASESIKKEQTELDILYSKLKNTAITTKERIAATNEWIKRYPEYANILSGENVSLGKLETAYKALSKEIYANAVARHYADKIGELSVKQEKEEIKRLNQKLTVAKAEQEYERLTAEYNKKKEQGFGSATAKLDAANKIELARRNVEEQKKTYNDLIENVNNYGKNITTISNHIQAADLFPQPQEGTYDYWKQQQENAEGVLKEIKSNVKKTLDDAAKEGKDLFSLGIDMSVVETYKKAVSEVNEAKKQLKIYDDKDKKTSGKTPADYQNELSDARLRAQQKLDAAYVTVLQEGYEKRRKQKELEYKEELASIDKQEKALEKKLNEAKKSGKKVTPEEQKQVHTDADKERSAALMVYEGELDKINKEASEKERKKLKEYAKQFQGYIAKYTYTEKEFDNKYVALKKDGASDETLSELEFQKKETLSEISNEFAEREATFQTWAAGVVNLNLVELRRLLVEAEKELEQQEILNPNDKGLATKRAKVTTLNKTISDKTKKPTKEKDAKRSLKEWAELNDVLEDVENSFSDIGGAVGEAAGDIIKTAGTIATSTLTIIDSITTLSENSAKGIQATGTMAAETMSTVEKASVILTIISAALQAVTAIVGMFNQTDYMEEFRKEMAALNYELSLAKLNAEISTDKNSIFGDDLWGNAIKNVELAHEALKRFNNTLDKIANRKMYTDYLGSIREANGLKNTYDSLGESLANMQLKVRHKT